MYYTRILTGIVLSLAMGAALADQAGVVREATGKVQLQRQGALSALSRGQTIQKDDVVLTGADGSVGIIFQDDTLMSLGPNSQITVDDFVFEPKEEKFSFVTNMSKGTASVATGLIGKLAPDTMEFKTPGATLGVRGTRFLVEVAE